jgi:hypothetical protein
VRFFIARVSHETVTLAVGAQVDEPLAHAIVEVDAPGPSSSNLARVSFANVRRPLDPRDAI